MTAKRRPRLTEHVGRKIARLVKSGEKTRLDCCVEFDLSYTVVCRAVQRYAGRVPKSTEALSPKQTQLESLESKLSNLAAIAFDLAVELERLRSR